MGWANKPTESNATEEMKEKLVKGKMKRTTFDIEEDLHKEFRIYAFNNNISMSELINNYLKTLLNK